MSQGSHEQPPVSICEVLQWNRGDVLFKRFEVEDVRVGGMAAVYVCRSGRDGRVVIKIPLVELPRLWIPEDHAIGVIAVELSAWLRLPPHPYVVTLLDTVQFPFFEVVDFNRIPRKRFSITGLLLDYGGPHNLREYLKRKSSLPLGDSLRLLAQIALGMEHASLHGVTPHLDLKPENVMVDDSGTARITDFGIARRVTWQPSASESSEPQVGARPTTIDGARVAGTPPYMAPEQWHDIRVCDQRTDIYSFGTLAYELFAGRHPFEQALHGQVFALRDHHVGVEPVCDDLPCDLRTKKIVERCLAKQPSSRFQTWTELLQSLPQDLIAELRDGPIPEKLRHRAPTQAIRLGIDYPELTGHARYAGYVGSTATDIEIVDALARFGVGRAAYVALRGLAAGRPPGLWTARILTRKLLLMALLLCIAPVFAHPVAAGFGALFCLILLWNLVLRYAPSLIELFKPLAALAIVMAPVSFWAYLALGRRRRPCPNCGGYPRRCHPLFILDTVRCWGRVGMFPLATAWVCRECGFMRGSKAHGRIARRWWIRHDKVRFLGIDASLPRPLWRRARPREVQFGRSHGSPARPVGPMPP